MKKKVILFILTLAMCIPMLAIPASAATFTDVSSSTWYYQAVEYCVFTKLMSGYGDGTFGPNDTLTRAMFVQVLYNMSEDNGNYAGVSSGFSDVSDSAWYSDAVAWAVDMGITSGTSVTTFSPTTAVTREQMATLACNYLNAYGISLDESDDAVSSFRDTSSVSDWAKSAVEYMRMTGIISGSYGWFRPKYTATRAEAATIFKNLRLAIDTAEQKNNDDSNDNASCDHWYIIASDTTTCTTSGVITYECGQCGDSYTISSPALGHSYGLETTITSATCTSTGTNAATCITCGTTTTFTTAALGHTYMSSIHRATSTTSCTITYWCSACGENYTEAYVCDDHTYEVVVTSPTCTKEGYTTYTCSTCGDSYTADTVAIIDHSYTEDKICSVCGDSCVEAMIQMTIGEATYSIGQSVSDLPTPDEILESVYDLTWYIFGTDTYENFFIAGVSGDEVVALMSAGKGFTYQGMYCGSTLTDYSTGTYNGISYSITVATDSNDDDIVHAAFVITKSYATATNQTTSAYAGEAKLNFHLTNAFRVYHGCSPLLWSDDAATTAMLHSQDMATNAYFSHTGLNDSTPASRLTAQGVDYSCCGENIAVASYASCGVFSYDLWVNSAGHRANMISSEWTYMGVGMAKSDYMYYYTQNFYA